MKIVPVDRLGKGFKIKNRRYDEQKTKRVDHQIHIGQMTALLQAWTRKGSNT